MALFSQYAIVAAEEALKDSGWKPENDEEREQTVGITTCWAWDMRLIKRGIGCLHRIWYRVS